MTVSKMITLLGEEKKINGLWHTKIKCKCGIVKFKPRSRILNGELKSCGCLKYESYKSIITHGASSKNSEHANIYSRWRGIITRCYNKNDRTYKNYGGRGVEMCEEWKESFESFRDWALENGYKKELSIDRIDNNKGYNPDNCRWVNHTVQGNNRRTNIYVVLNGQRKTLKQWCEHLGCNYTMANKRYRRGVRGYQLFSSAKRQPYTEEEELYLIKNWGIKTDEEISEFLGRTESSVRSKANNMKIEKPNRRFRAFDNGKVVEGTYKELSKKLGVKMDRIYHLSRNGRLKEIKKIPNSAGGGK